MSRASQVILLCEDRRQQTFVARYLQRLGFTNHNLRRVALPAGHGCGEQWVRQQFPIQLAACQNRSAKAGTRLVVAIDADTRDPAERMRALKLTLSADELQRSCEWLCVLIPRRNIETWILCLVGEVVNEIDDYKSAPGIDRRIGEAALNLFHWTRSNALVPEHAVASLRSAFASLKQLEYSQP